MFKFQTLKSQDNRNQPGASSNWYNQSNQSRGVFESYSNSPYLENLENYKREDASRDVRTSQSRNDPLNNYVTFDPKNTNYGKTSSYKQERTYHIQQDEEDAYNKISTVKPSATLNKRASMNKRASRSASVNIGADKPYDEWMIPPNLTHLEKHMLATQVGRERKHAPGVYPETCPCCGYEVERNFFNLCVSSNELGYLGPGYPLYFNFIRLCFIMLLITFGLNGFYNILTNYRGRYCHNLLKQLKETPGKVLCLPDWLNTLSYINKLDEDSFVKEVQEYLNIGTVIVLMFLMFFFRKQQRELDSAIDMGFQTPRDYTIIVKNIPISPLIDYHGELRNLFGLFAGNIKLNVRKITLTSDSAELNINLNLLNRELDKKKRSHAQRDGDQQRQTDINIAELEEKIRKFSMQALLDPKCFTGVALISFNTEEEKELVVKKTAMTTWTRLKDYFAGDKPAENIQNLPRGSISVIFHGKKLIIEEAPEPGDIIWENIVINTKKKIYWRIFGIFIFAFILCVSLGMFGIIYFIQKIFVERAKDLVKENKSPVDELYYIDVFTFMLWMIFVFWNEFFLPYLFKITTKFEYWSTKSKFTISVARKLAMAYFFNTALVFLLLNLVTNEQPFADGGFIQRENWIFVLNTFITPIIWIIDPWYIFKSFRRRMLFDGRIKNITQGEAQQIVENPTYDIAKRYADTVKTMWFVFFYAHVMPLAIIWGMLALFLYYWVDKINFLYRRTVKDILDLSVSIEMIEMIEYCIPLYGLAHFLFSYYILDNFTWQSIFVFFAGLTYLIFPMQILNEVIFKIANRNESLTYDEVVGDFDDDYDRRNPVTSREALKRWINFRKLGGTKNFIPQNNI